jgi:hypothetical protein
MADESITFSSNTTQYERGADRMKKKNQEVADSVKKVGGEVGKVNRDINEMSKGYLKSLVGITAIVQALRSVQQAQTEIRKEKAGAFNKLAGESVEIDTAIAMTGAKGEDADSIRQAIEASADKQAAISAVRSNAEKFGRALTPQKYAAGATSAGSGVMSSQETDMAFMTGTTPVGQRLSELSPGARAELERRRNERYDEEAKASKRAADQQRLVEKTRANQGAVGRAVYDASTAVLGDQAVVNAAEVRGGILPPNTGEAMADRQRLIQDIKDSNFISGYLKRRIHGVDYNDVYPVKVKNMDKRPIVNGKE